MNKYYEGPGESDLGIGVVYVEVDVENDWVTKQIENYGDVWRHGCFNGRIAEGHICDQHASKLLLTEKDAISAERFEQMWLRAIRFQGRVQ